MSLGLSLASDNEADVADVTEPCRREEEANGLSDTKNRWATWRHAVPWKAGWGGAALKYFISHAIKTDVHERWKVKLHPMSSSVF